jgi:8-oxo-dGTP diphosphatase
MTHPPLAVTVDLVLMTVVESQLVALLQRRQAEPFSGRLALPGGFVRVDEGLDEAARRILIDKAGLAADEGTWLEQLYTFGAPDRDPRIRTVSVAYFALIPCERLAQVATTRDDLSLTAIDRIAQPLAFDHAAILALAHDRLRAKLDYAPVALALLPAIFTLRDLQRVHEAITGATFNKPAFRRRMLDTGWITPTGQRETQTAFRPAELYRRTP